MNGIYLNLLLREIKERVLGRYIQDTYIRERIIQIYLGRDSLYISLYPQALAIYLDKKSKGEFERLKSFGEIIKGYKIIEVEQENLAPVVKIYCGREKNIELLCSLYRDAPNVIIKTESFQKNLYKRYIQRDKKISILELDANEFNRYSNKGLCEKFDGIDTYFVSDLDEKNLHDLKKILMGKQISPRLVKINPLRISLFAKKYIKRYSSMNDLLKDGIKRFIQEKSMIASEIQREKKIKRLKKRLQRLNKRMVEYKNYEEYRISGELILANISKIKRGLSKIDVFNPYTQHDTHIALDASKSPQENARAYFLRYKKAKRGIPKIRETISKFEKNIEELSEKEFISNVVPPAMKQRIKKRRPFREFILPSGSIVYVGKNARSNDKLTLKFAVPNDYFFHTRGSEGAHTILRPKISRGQRPQRKDIETAAAIAAYFSKVKGQKNVPVSYTQRKYIKKNKRGGPGSVILMREEVIFVNPKLPDD